MFLPPVRATPAGRRALLGAALVAAAAGCGDGGKAPAAKLRPPPLVAVAPVERRDVPVEVRGPVDLRPLAQADVGSKTLGYLDAVLVDRGDAVKKGQLVALVRPSDLPDQLAAARSGLAQAQSAGTLARANLERAEALAPEAVVSQQELQQARSRAAETQASEAAARAQIGALAVRLGETRIVSPLAGVVLQRRLDPGALVGPPGGGAIITVARVDVLRVFLNVNEREIAGLSVGLPAHVEVDALPGRSFAGRVTRLAPGFDPATRTLEAEVQLDNREGLLRPGMYGRGAVVLAVHPGALVVPVGAVQLSDGRAYVFVVDGDAVQRRAIETGVDGGGWLELRSGLSGGERLVVAGIDGLADKMKIRAAAAPAGGAGRPAVDAATGKGSGGPAVAGAGAAGK